MEFPSESLAEFFEVVLGGESKTYNDHNYYKTGNKIGGYIQGSWGSRYGGLKKDLSEYTLGEVKEFQRNPRNSTGQLWATGRYQIIPDTLVEVQKRMGVSDSAKFDYSTQNTLALGLLKKRPTVWKYINKEIPDTKENLEKASLEMAKEWSSLGVPYAMKGRSMNIKKNESYYKRPSGSGDKAHVSNEKVQDALKALRESHGKKKASSKKPNKPKTEKQKKKGRAVGYTLLGLSVVGLAFVMWKLTRK
jgi:muramidase (phage lysozyme)